MSRAIALVAGLAPATGLEAPFFWANRAAELALPPYRMHTAVYTGRYQLAPNGELALVASRVMAVCDGTDGLVDGLIDDPRRCDFDPARDVPQCPGGSDRADCPTAPQTDALKKVCGARSVRIRRWPATKARGSIDDAANFRCVAR